MWKIAVPAVIVALLTVSGPAMADKAVTGREAFELWHKCTPVGLIVTVPTETQELTGLTEDEIETTVGGKLKQARLYTPKTSLGVLAVTLDSTELPMAFSIRRLVGRLFDHGAVFLIRIEFWKHLEDPFYPEKDELYRIPTWNRTVFGSFEDKSDTWLMSEISERVDDFVRDYLRVNAAACGETRHPAP